MPFKSDKTDNLDIESLLAPERLSLGAPITVPLLHFDKKGVVLSRELETVKSVEIRYPNSRNRAKES